MKVNKPYTDEQYAELAIFCNENGMVILDSGDYLESVYPPEPTEEEKKAEVKRVREQYFDMYVDWYQSKPLLWEEMSEEEKTEIAGYRQYLKDYTKQENWWEQNPKTLEEWKQ